MSTLTDRQKWILLLLAYITLLIGTITGALFLARQQSSTTPLVSTTPRPSFSPVPTPKSKEAVSVLLIGHGGDGHSGGSLADSMLLLNIDTSRRQTTFISIPRDTWARIPTSPGIYEYHKLNHAYSIGGGSLTKEMIQLITGLPVDYYVSIDFSGLTKAIDTLGGVDVEVSQTFDDYFYPIKGEENNSCGFSPEKITQVHAQFSGFNLEKQFTCRYEHLHFEKGKTHIDGATALKFVRSRHSDVGGGDFSRSQRQIQLLLAIKEKALSLQALKDAPAFFRQFAAFIKSDLNEGAVDPLLTLVGDPTKYTTKTVNLSTENVFRETKSGDGQYILIPHKGENVWTDVQKYISQELQKE
jgi:polyisoprenyl-teichoic acid--peptidoglycan teichoic acid transferase